MADLSDLERTVHSIARGLGAAADNTERWKGAVDDLNNVKTVAAGQADTSGANAGAGQNPGLGGGLLGNTTGVPTASGGGVAGGAGGASKSGRELLAGTPHMTNNECDGLWGEGGKWPGILGYGEPPVGPPLRVYDLEGKLIWSKGAVGSSVPGAGSAGGGGFSPNGFVGYGTTKPTGYGGSPSGPTTTPGIGGGGTGGSISPDGRAIIAAIGGLREELKLNTPLKTLIGARG